MASLVLQAGVPNSLSVDGVKALTPFISSSVGAGPHNVDAGDASCGVHYTDGAGGIVDVIISTTALNTNEVVMVGYSDVGAIGSWVDTIAVAGSLTLHCRNAAGQPSIVSWWIINRT